MWTIIIQFPLQGAFQIFVFVPVIPEMIERIQYKYGIVEGEDEFLDSQLNDKVNDVYATFYAIASTTAPIIGSWINHNIGSQYTCDLVAFINLFYMFLLIIFNCGLGVFKENRDFVNGIKELREKAEEIRR